MGAGARGLGQQTGRAVYSGRLLLAREGTGGRRPPCGAAAGRARGGARSSEAPHRAVPSGSPPGSAPRMPPTFRQRPGALPLRDAKGGSVRHKVSLHRQRHGLPGSRGTSVQSPRRQAYRGAGARGMVGRPAQLRRGRRTPRGRAAGARGRGAGGRGLAGGGGGCAGPRPAATIPPAALAAESRGRRCAGSPAGTPGVSPLGTVPAGGSVQGGLRLLDAPRAEAPPRAGTLCPSPPPLPFSSSLRPAGLHFPPLLTPPLLSPSRPPPGCHKVSLRRGGAGRAPPLPGTGQHGRPRASRWKLLPAHLAAWAGVEILG